MVRASTDRNVAIGSAANEDSAQALIKATIEAFLQVILASERIADPKAVNLPDDHAALYNNPEWRRKLDWIEWGELINPRENITLHDNQVMRNAYGYDLKQNIADLHVVRVLDPALIPLTFGYDSDPAGRADMRAILLGSGYSEDEPLDPHAFA